MPSFVLLFPSGPHKMEQKQFHDFSLCNARMIIADYLPHPMTQCAPWGMPECLSGDHFGVGHGFLGFGVTGRDDSLTPARAFNTSITCASLDSP